MNKLLQNKYVLYITLFIAVTNVLGYLAVHDFDSVMVFIGIAGLTSYFSKNMIVILGCAVLATNIIKTNKFIREGFKGKKERKKGHKKDATSKKEKFSKSNFPSSRPKKIKEEDDDEVDNVSRVDYASTMELAYDNLNKMLGEGGMKNLTKDTKGLMDQQEKLMKNLKDFAPLMEQAGDMLDKLGGMENIQGLMGKLGDISSLAAGKK